MTTTTTEASRPMQDAGAASTAAQTSEREPVMLRKRIGSTEYLVTARFSPTATESLQDKLMRLIVSDPLVRSASRTYDRDDVSTSA